jgi:hypothetical protein
VNTGSSDQAVLISSVLVKITAANTKDLGSRAMPCIVRFPKQTPIKNLTVSDEVSHQSK